MMKMGFDDFVYGLFVGCAFTASFYFFQVGGHVSRAEVYQRGNKPAVMRVYKSGPDTLLVEDKFAGESTGKYLSMEEHLKSFSNETHRQQEETDIKAAARWYEE